MDHFRRFIGLLTVVCSTTFGGTITINSNAVDTINSGGSATLEILKHPAWAEPFEGSAWVSTRPSGDNARSNFFEFGNDTVITFLHYFNLTSVASDGSLSVRADDTGSVSLNGVLLLAGSTSRGTSCSAVPIGCLVSTTGVLNFSDLQPHLVIGTNVLSFAVHQTNGAAFGLNYSGSISYPSNDPHSHAPEPASYALSAACLLIAALGARRRGRSRQESSVSA